MDLKLGKLPVKEDKRTITLKSILKELPPLPLIYDNHNEYDIEDNSMFGNDQYGSCVIASRGHHTYVLEGYEQGKQIEIKDQEVIDEYLEQTGGSDTGLVLLWSLRDWKNGGWSVSNFIYTIYAFASVDWKDHEEVKQCIHLLGGVNAGMNLYKKDMEQFRAGEVWCLTGNDGTKVGGHGIHIFAYDGEGVTCMTWGKAQWMSWAFLDARIDEAYGIVDQRNHAESHLDCEKLDKYLQDITNGRGAPQGCFVTGLIKKFLRSL